MYGDSVCCSILRQLSLVALFVHYFLLLLLCWIFRRPHLVVLRVACTSNLVCRPTIVSTRTTITAVLCLQRHSLIIANVGEYERRKNTARERLTNMLETRNWKAKSKYGRMPSSRKLANKKKCWVCFTCCALRLLLSCLSLPCSLRAFSFHSLTDMLVPHFSLTPTVLSVIQLWHTSSHTSSHARSLLQPPPRTLCLLRCIG